MSLYSSPRPVEGAQGGYGFDVVFQKKKSAPSAPSAVLYIDTITCNSVFPPRKSFIVSESGVLTIRSGRIYIECFCRILGLYALMLSFRYETLATK